MQLGTAPALSVRPHAKSRTCPRRASRRGKCMDRSAPDHRVCPRCRVRRWTRRLRCRHGHRRCLSAHRWLLRRLPRRTRSLPPRSRTPPPARRSRACAPRAQRRRNQHASAPDCARAAAGSGGRRRERRGGCTEGHLQCIKLLLKAKAQVNAKDQHGFTALMGASQSGHVDIIKILLNARADVNAREHEDGETAITMAMHCAQNEAVKCLMEFGATMPSGTSMSRDRGP